MKFEGSTSGDGSVFDLNSGVGYNFSRHFGVDLGIPYYFVGTPSSVKKNNPQAVSGDGLGSLGADLKWNFAGELVNYDPELGQSFGIRMEQFHPVRRFGIWKYG
jgi:hypothetical protein